LATGHSGTVLVIKSHSFIVSIFAGSVRNMLDCHALCDDTT